MLAAKSVLVGLFSEAGAVLPNPVTDSLGGERNNEVLVETPNAPDPGFMNVDIGLESVDVVREAGDPVSFLE